MKDRYSISTDPEGTVAKLADVLEFDFSEREVWFPNFFRGGWDRIAFVDNFDVIVQPKKFAGTAIGRNTYVGYPDSDVIIAA